MDLTLKSLEPVLEASSPLRLETSRKVFSPTSSNDSDSAFAEELLEQSLDVAANKYGSSSLLVGGTSDEGECEDVAVVMQNNEGNKLDWEDLIKALGLDGSKISNPSSTSLSSSNLATVLDIPADSPFAESLAELTDLTRFVATFSAGMALLAILVGKRKSQAGGAWIALVGCGPIAE